MGSTVVTVAGNSDLISQEYSKTIVYGSGNSNLIAQEVHDVLHISSSQGLVYDAAGGGLTNSRTGTANVIDSESIKQVLANEIRFKNHKRIRNLIASKDFSGWTKSGVGSGIAAVVTSNYALDPDGNLTATRVQMDLNNGNLSTDYSRIYIAGGNIGVGQRVQFSARSTDNNYYDAYVIIGSIRYYIVLTQLGRRTIIATRQRL